VKCTAATTTTANLPTITGCDINRPDTGKISLIISGTNFAQGAAVSVGGLSPKKVKFSNLSTGGTFTTMTAIGKFCGGLPGDLIVTNPDGTKSAAFNCTKTCQ